MTRESFHFLKKVAKYHNSTTVMNKKNNIFTISAPNYLRYLLITFAVGLWLTVCMLHILMYLHITAIASFWLPFSLLAYHSGSSPVVILTPGLYPYRLFWHGPRLPLSVFIPAFSFGVVSTWIHHACPYIPPYFLDYKTNPWFDGFWGKKISILRRSNTHRCNNERWSIADY
jgi:hypothetical protein